MAIKIDGIDHVVFFVKNIARSRKFSKDAFAFSVLLSCVLWNNRFNSNDQI